MNEFLSAKSLVLSQGSEIAAQLINYYFYAELAGLFLLSSALILSVKAIRAREEEIFFFGLLGILGFFPALLCVLFDFIELTTTPKAWLLEHVLNLLHK